MARPTVPGTPPTSRSSGYVRPDRSRRTLAGSLAIGGSIVLLLIGLYAAGWRRTLSAGPLASAHAPLDARCVQCHETGLNVVDLRCERCHDPGGAERLSNAAHVLFGSGDSRKAEQAEVRPCAGCHIDHRGRAFTLAAADSRECATCHNFSSLARHPEFAIVRAASTTGLGVQFPHDLHIEEAKKAAGLECSTCHQPTTDRRGFLPISFERHCASCHTEQGFLTGETDPLPADLLVLPENLPAEAAGSNRPVLTDGPRRSKIATRVVHRDAWVLFNARRLRRGIDPDGIEAERLALRNQIAALEAQRAAPRLGQVPTSELPRVIAAVEQEVSALDAALAQPVAAGADRRALRELTASVQTLARQLSALEPTLTEELRTLADGRVAIVEASAAASNETPDRMYERRRGELLALADAIAARADAAGQSELKARALALRRRIDALRPTTDTSPSDPALLQTRLANLDEVFRLLRAIPDAAGQLEGAEADNLRRRAQAQLGAGLTLDDFESRRRELLQLLDVIERRAGGAVQLRVVSLRERVAALRPGGSGDADLTRLRRRKMRLLDRLRLERELAQSGDRNIVQPLDAIEGAAIETRLKSLRAALTQLERAPRMSAPGDAKERTMRIGTLGGLLLPCLQCHELSGARLAPVKAAGSVMVRSTFTHAPHVTQTSCDTCHVSTKTSKLATDVNVPGVSKCQTCHRPSQARAACETCHVYHPKSISALGAL
jgi:hypothetical protein